MLFIFTSQISFLLFVFSFYDTFLAFYFFVDAYCCGLNLIQRTLFQFKTLPFKGSTLTNSFFVFHFQSTNGGRCSGKYYLPFVFIAFYLCLFPVCCCYHSTYLLQSVVQLYERRFCCQHSLQVIVALQSFGVGFQCVDCIH